ncbi:endonuclease/exonuclease/phosphatase family protein [Maritimibacter alkaliphilus]|uniref:endonuclease/exonuclease/phosphatase family protein n=1 Tax=Maritimibacter alkaliphilus TaxID=404236 RepID=UPI001C93AA8B|nr:endonuclease/exonuclease/phosphatase family protein [Maritimibacter alkaliphilus]MBY6092102.1 endonuclease/exonuclease/phosphatase family protein [Maritimibacter alkaliphilus]
MITNTVAELQAPPLPDLSGVTRDVPTHDALIADLPCFQTLETGGSAPSAPLALPVTVGAWNLERCLFPEASALKVADCDLLLLSEMDSGMARTKQRNTTAAVAEANGYAYAYALEFLEMGLGSPIEHEFCDDDHNLSGFHGNAVAARTTLVRPFALRLFGHRQWFTDAEQPRLGERVAVGAVVETSAGPLLAVSTHLESAAGQGHRCDQIAGLIASLDDAFPGVPVLIGGDLNTGNHSDGTWRDEELFDVARDAGFIVHGGPEEQMTTRPSLITRWPDRAMKLDWFLARGVTLEAVEIRSSLDPNGTPLSDHDAIVAQITGLG